VFWCTSGIPHVLSCPLQSLRLWTLYVWECAHTHNHIHTHTFTYTQVHIAERGGEAVGAAPALMITQCKSSAAADARRGDGGVDKRMVSMLATRTYIYFLVFIYTV
jgi:hypothetical protein